MFLQIAIFKEFMASDEETKTASMVAIIARLKRGTADNEKLIAHATVLKELTHFATQSSKAANTHG